MDILLILRNLYGSQGFFEEEEYLSESDRNVISEAMALKEKYGGTVSAVLFSEDTPDCEKTLKKVYTYGVSKAYHVVFQDFDFSDTKTFAKVIAKVIERTFPGYDLFLFGRLAYDGDAVTIATMTAEHLRLPRVVYSKEIEKKNDHLICRKYISPKEEAALEVRMPALVQSIREKGIRRQPKIADIVRAYSDAEIYQLDGETVYRDIYAGASSVRLVSETEPDDAKEKELKILNGVSDIESAEALIHTLKELGFSADGL
ncbi:MAG: hypothetical protein HFE75_02955 [Firmicutes bacterium]|jgi:electron transfer flavoprotein beta subunit|nr:hypothetical protein [Bacillota bacterium]